MHRGFGLVFSLVAASLCLIASRTAHAQCGTACTDMSGGVALPAGFELSLPFQQGENVKILSGYGPNAGSSLHCRTQDTGCANDYFALDLVLPDHPNSGKGQPVLAAASGTVIAAGWGSSGWAAYGQRVYIQHDFNADGHKYTTLYAHLDSLSVTTGQKVKRGDPLGTLGQSCMGAKSCSNFSTPHVHFSLHRDSNLGGSGSGGSYGGRGVKPEPMDGVTGITQGQVHPSKNGQSTTPPAVCDVVIPWAETVIEDDTPCLAAQGNLSETTAGHGGHAYHAQQDTPDPDYAEGGVWLLNFAQAGSYDLFAWVPTGVTALTSQAVYKVQHAGTSKKVSVDQAAAAGGWAPLGSFAFAAGGDQWVRLGDNFLSPSDKGKSFVIDALKIAPSGSKVDAGAGSGPTDAGGSGWPDGSAALDAGIGAAGAAGQAGVSPAGDEDGAGCACRAAPGSLGGPRSALLLLCLGLGALRRRRIRRSEAL